MGRKVINVVEQSEKTLQDKIEKAQADGDSALAKALNAELVDLVTKDKAEKAQLTDPEKEILKHSGLDEAKGNPFSEEFELSEELESALKKNKYEGDIEVTREEDRTKYAKLKPAVAKELKRTSDLFLSEKHADEYLDNAKKAAKKYVEDQIKKDGKAVKGKIAVEITDRIGDNYVGSGNAALYITLTAPGAEPVEIEPSALYYAGSGDVVAEDMSQWNWVFWLAADESPFQDSSWVDAYEKDRCGQALEQFAQTLDESDLKFELKNAINKIERELHLSDKEEEDESVERVDAQGRKIPNPGKKEDAMLKPAPIGGEQPVNEAGGKAIADYKITDHGVEDSSHFQGHGTAMTKWDDCATGAGSSERGALEDALEQLAQMGYEIPEDLEAEVAKASDKDDVPEEAEESFHYVSVDVNVARAGEATESDKRIANLRESINEFEKALEPSAGTYFVEAFKVSMRVAKNLEEAYQKVVDASKVEPKVEAVDEFNIPLPGFTADELRDDNLSEDFSELLGVKKTKTQVEEAKDRSPKSDLEAAKMVVEDLKALQEQSKKLAVSAEKGLLDESEAKNFLKKTQKYLDEALEAISEDDDQDYNIGNGYTVTFGGEGKNRKVYFYKDGKHVAVVSSSDAKAKAKELGCKDPQGHLGEMTEGDDDFKTIYVKKEFAKDDKMLVDLANKIERAIGRDVAVTGSGGINIYTLDPKLIQKAVEIMGDKYGEHDDEHYPSYEKSVGIKKEGTIGEAANFDAPAKVKASTMSVLMAADKDGGIGSSIMVGVDVKNAGKSKGEYANLTLRFDRGEAAVLAGYPMEWGVYDVNVDYHDHDSPTYADVLDSGEDLPKGTKAYVSKETEIEIFKQLKKSLEKQFKDPMFKDHLGAKEQAQALKMMDAAIAGKGEGHTDESKLKEDDDEYDGHEQFTMNQKLSIRAHKSEPGKGLTYPSFTGKALEDGFTGGWDVWDMENEEGETVSVYGFSISALDEDDDGGDDDGGGEDRPDEEDIFFSSSGPLGSKTTLSAGGKFVGEFNSHEEAEEAAKAWMKKNNFFPNAWIVSDHGNHHPTTIGEDKAGLQALKDKLSKLDRLDPDYEKTELEINKTQGFTKVETAPVKEAYVGFKKLKAKIAQHGKARDAGAIAASIGREKYGKEAFQKAAAAGKKMGESALNEWSYSFKEKEDQKKQLIEFYRDMMISRVENDANSGDYDEKMIGGDVEDQLTGLQGEVNGKKVADVYKALVAGLSKEEIEQCADDAGVVDKDGWAYYDGHEYKTQVNAALRAKADTGEEESVNESGEYQFHIYADHGKGKELASGSSADPDDLKASLKTAWMKLDKEVASAAQASLVHQGHDYE